MDPLDRVSEEIQSDLRMAHLLRQRGDAVGADKILSAVIEKHPDHPEALLLKAEALEKSGKLKEARDLLAEVVASDKRNIAAERKHAQLVLRVAERETIVNLAMNDNLASYMNPEGVRKSAGTAAFFSMLCPGFGQIYNAHFIKGIVFLVIAVLAWVGLLQFGVLNGRLTGWFIPSLVTLVGVYLVAIIDAAVAAGKQGAPERPMRPTPPVDKPFE